MNTKKLLQILSSLPADTPVTTMFRFGNSYSSGYESPIIGINLIENKDKTLTAVIRAQIIKQEEVA